MWDLLKSLLLSAMILINLAIGQKVGLVLSGGGARGFAHIGTLKMLDSLEIPVDFIVGTSMGALAGAMYAAGHSGNSIEQAALALDWEELFSDQIKRRQLPYFEKNDYGKYQVVMSLDGFKPVPLDAFATGQKVILTLSEFLPEYTEKFKFLEMPIPFLCIAVDLITGNEVQLTEGILPKALRASLTIPTVFSPVIWGDSLLVDGGLRNNLPIDIAKIYGADIIIAVHAGTPKRSRNELLTVRDIFEQTIGIIEYDKEDENEILADLLIKPDLKNLNQTDFSKPKIRKINKAGISAAQKMIPELLAIKKLLHNKKFKKPQKHNFIDELSIKNVKIIGNVEIPDKFIERLLGIHPDITITINELNQRISDLYGLGYFKLIEYELTDNFSGLIVRVWEKPMSRFRMGARWDNEHQIIMAFDLQMTNKFIPGLRLENQFQFGGIRRNEFSISYPSRRLNTPFFPYFTIIDSWTPITIYQKNGTKQDRFDEYHLSANIGLGMVIGNVWSTNLKYSLEKSTFQSVFENSGYESLDFENETNGTISLLTTIDNIDDNLLPRSGFYFNLQTEMTYDPISTFDYYSIQSVVDLFIPVKKHSFRFNLTGNYVEGSNIPYPKILFSLNEYYHAGFQRWKIYGDSFFTGRMEFIYQHKRDIFVHFFYNPILYARYNDLNTFLSQAGGIGFTFTSPIGPLKLNWSLSPNGLYDSNGLSNGFYLSAGYQF